MAMSACSSSFFSGLSSSNLSFPNARRAPTFPLQRCSALRCVASNKKPARLVLPREQRLGPQENWTRTYYPKEADHLPTKKKWYVVDAANKRLGRMASTIAYYLRGKDNPMHTPSLDMGAYVIVINAEKVGVTGNKRSQKLYRRHSGRPGGLTEETFEQLQKRIPERIVEHAVKGMLPKNRLGRALFRKLKVFKGEAHPHTAQQPVPLPIRDKRINLRTEEADNV